MKILVIAHDIPYPPIHGGRVDMWRRLNLLHSIGAEIFLVTWSYQPLDDESRRALTSICAKFYVLPIRRTWKHRSSRLKYLLTLPLYEAMRVLEVKVWRDLLILVEKFNPYIIWLDGLYGGKLAVDFSNYLKIPIYYRSHNIEYQYMRKLSNQASNYRAKVAALLGCWNLHCFENKIMKVAIHVFDVSIDDIAIWLKNGYTHISYLPPIAPRINEGYARVVPTYDIAYLGNLHVANNKSGVNWLLDEIMPEVWKVRPSTTLLIAGSNPDQEIVRRTAVDKRIFLKPDPEDALGTLLMGFVLVNPVRQGSGVSIKTIEMMATGRPIVSTSQGVMGLHTKECKNIHIGHSAIECASLMLRLLEHNESNTDKSICSLEPYTSEFVAKQLIAYIPELGNTSKNTS